MKYAHYNKTDGRLIGWYDSNIHTAIPTPNIEISEADWQVAIDNNYNYVDTTNGVLSFKDFRSDEEKQKQYIDSIEAAIQNMLDTKAREFRYDNMMSARSYTGYSNPFQAEAQKLAVWASNCWVKAGQIEADVEAGNRPMPTVDEVLSEMPAYA